MLSLSVLDQSTIVTGRSPDTSIRESIRLARHCEDLGYARYWCAEHHNSDSQAGTAPEILIAAIAATTSRIRVGSAGVMLPHYSALKVAEQFRVLDAIAPGRIDLGLGRAPGSDGRTAYALNPRADTRRTNSRRRCATAGWTGGEKLVEGHPFRDIRAQPMAPTKPEMWILGSSDYGAQVAAYFGLPFCFAHFISEGRGAGAGVRAVSRGLSAVRRAPLAARRDLRVGLRGGDRGGGGVAVQFAGDFRLNRDKGIYAALPSPEEAAAYVLSDADRARIERTRARAIYGTPDVVGGKLRALAETFQIEEIAVPHRRCMTPKRGGGRTRCWRRSLGWGR